MLVKKYSNRRLYDTEESRYITLEELAVKIRGGADAQVVDAKTGADLTQATLTQIILESRGAAHLLAVPVLTQLVRMGDDAFAEFFSRYVSWSLEVYLQAKQGIQAVSPLNPFSPGSLVTNNPLARLLLGSAPWMDAPSRSAAAPPPMPSTTSADVAQLRRELEDLKRSVRPRRKRA